MSVPALPIVHSVADLRAAVKAWRQSGERVALTPTMGALHDGHLSLVAQGRAQAERVVATIFVNPTQFGPNEDFDAYPRGLEADAALLAGAGCDLLYAPSVGEMYPPGFATSVRVTGLTEVLCGAARPGHFDGVAQVVTKLLLQAGTDLAIFGEKDWQQLTVIRRLVADLNIDCAILGAPILRESDGLAMSSRNRYLSPAERAAAPALYASLRQAAEEIAARAAIDEVLARAREQILSAGFSSIDYLEARSADHLTLVTELDPATPTRLFAAAHLGRARLIDNISIPR
ncbi:MAG: pantoate--beta-alanine ligase [Neomegalonema sp.]|nr:pantoate--beta-alanine ligase [Neomegalonema sp.]